MTFTDLSLYFQKLENTTSRNTMTEILAELLQKATPEVSGKISYLLQGRVAPLYEPIEFGVADKMMIRAIALALNTKNAQVVEVFKKTGDLGTAAEQMKQPGFKKRLSDIPQQSLLDTGVSIKREQLSIAYVFEEYTKSANASGPGSQEEKIKILARLIALAEPLSVRYLVRIPLGKLRLGFSDMTILDALSWMEAGNKSLKKEMERAYNVRPDLGFIASTVCEKGVKGLKRVVPKPTTPIMMARANRLTSATEIFEKIGKCAVEYKYDGLRLQVHKVGKTIKLFSRKLEDLTPSFPDIVQAIRNQVKAHDIIFEGEIVAYNPETNVFVPFQETMQRRRKYDIEAKAAEIPVKLFAFELLFVNGTSLLTQGYKERKEKLKHNIQKGNTIIYAQERLVTTEQDVDEMFEESIKLHFEGIIAKKLDGLYEAGIRGWNWIKYKKAMNKKLADTIDVVVMGYTLGEGKRTDFGVGQFLTGVYDEKKDIYVTVTKIGTGLTDEQFREFVKRAHKFRVKEKPPLYEVDKLFTPDVWMDPGLVVEVGCDEITRSAAHTAGRELQPSKSGKAFEVKTPGYALRFPRLVRFRDDRRPEDATTVREIKQLYVKQNKS